MVAKRKRRTEGVIDIDPVDLNAGDSSQESGLQALRDVEPENCGASNHTSGVRDDATERSKDVWDVTFICRVSDVTNHCIILFRDVRNAQDIPSGRRSSTAALYKFISMSFAISPRWSRHG